MPIRILAGVIGAFFLLQGVNWLLDPSGAAEALGMPLLDGIGRSTQIGDMASFFLCLGGFALFGAYRSNPTWLRASGILVGSASLTRTIAWGLQGADFAAVFVVVEVVTGGALLFAASRSDANNPAKLPE